MTDSNSPAISKRNSTKLSKRSKRSGYSRTTVGIEIGYRAIHMVQLKNTAEEEVFFRKSQTFEFDPNLTLESSEFASILKAALKEFCGSSKEFEIWAAPKLDRARLHHIKIPKVNPAQLAGAVYWGLQREDSFIENETVVDFYTKEEAKLSEILDVTGALIERECIENIQKAFSQTGYPLTGIGLPLLALSHLVELSGAEKLEAPVLICQQGQLSTSVSVLHKGQLIFTRNIPLGLQNLAEILVQEPNSTLGKEEASHTILNLGLEDAQFSLDECQQHERAFASLQPTLERAARQIERTIDYFQSNFDTEPMGAIFLGGEIAARGRLFQFFSERLSLKVVAIDPFSILKLQSKVSLPSDKADRIAFGPAFGLALESSQTGINLAHTYKARQNEGKHTKLATFATISLTLLALAATLFYNTKRLKLRSLETDQDNLEKTLNALGPRLTQAIITEANEEVRLLDKQRRTATHRYEGLALLSEITRLTPENISLLHISAAMGSTITFLDPSTSSGRPTITTTNTNGLPIKTAADRKGTMLLKGVVTGTRTSLETSLTIYIARLDQSHLFNTIEVESTELIQSSGKLHLTFTLNVETITDIVKK